MSGHLTLSSGLPHCIMSAATTKTHLDRQGKSVHWGLNIANEYRILFQNTQRGVERLQTYLLEGLIAGTLLSEFKKAGCSGAGSR